MRILLINPPVFDIRFPWSRFHQPTILLRLATFFRDAGDDVRLIDTLYRAPGAQLRRERVGTPNLDGQTINKWRYGLGSSALTTRLRDLAKEHWVPDRIYVEGCATFWWEGVAEATRAAKQRFPGAHVIVVGTYPQLAGSHALVNTSADEVITGPWNDLYGLPSDLSLYPTNPAIGYITVGSGQRTAKEVVDEIVAKVTKHRLRSFAFADHAVATHQPILFRAILEELINRNLGIHLYAPGTVTYAELVTQPDLAGLLRRAGYRDIYFADDRDIPLGISPRAAWVRDARQAVELCHHAGFRPRDGTLAASLSLGRLGEDLMERAETATELSHFVGSIIFWPYQPSIELNSPVPLEDQNGKLFPLRSHNGATYQDYQAILSLASVLNAKYHDATFDFLGDGLIAQLFRDSVVRGAWDPDPSVKGSLMLPMVQR